MYGHCVSNCVGKPTVLSRGVTGYLWASLSPAGAHTSRAQSALAGHLAPWGLQGPQSPVTQQVGEAEDLRPAEMEPDLEPGSFLPTWMSGSGAAAPAGPRPSPAPSPGGGEHLPPAAGSAVQSLGSPAGALETEPRAGRPAGPGGSASLTLRLSRLSGRQTASRRRFFHLTSPRAAAGVTLSCSGPLLSTVRHPCHGDLLPHWARTLKLRACYF